MLYYVYHHVYTSIAVCVVMHDIVYMYMPCLTSSTFPSTREPRCEFVDFTPFHTHFGMGQVTYY